MLQTVSIRHFFTVCHGRTTYQK